MSGVKEETGTARWIDRTIREFVECSPTNSLKSAGNEKAWDEPLVGFSRGDDPLYEEIKRSVGPFCWTPVELFEKTFPDLEVSADELSVISWVLPQTEQTKRDSRKETRLPAERWARSRIFGEEGNVALAEHLTVTLNDAGYPAVAPMRSPLWEMRVSERFGFASTWSERHAAFVSGLGTFGLCDGLITPVGKAMRVGSVVARVELPPTQRPYTNHRAYCLHFSSGSCRKCIERCPAGAISEAGHDKAMCYNYLFPLTSDYVQNQFGFKGYGCGLCQTAVPCESKIPALHQAP